MLGLPGVPRPMLGSLPLLTLPLRSACQLNRLSVGLGENDLGRAYADLRGWLRPW
jgi:hypothetical protein